MNDEQCYSLKTAPRAALKLYALEQGFPNFNSQRICRQRILCRRPSDTSSTLQKRDLWNCFLGFLRVTMKLSSFFWWILRMERVWVLHRFEHPGALLYSQQRTRAPGAAAAAQFGTPAIEHKAENPLDRLRFQRCIFLEFRE